jgi:hypothetical protein
MRGLVIVLSVIGVLCSAQSAMADKRVAFVVGNGAYKNAPRLPNPPTDARAMVKALLDVGFDVVEGFDLTRDEMKDRLYEFGRKAEGADVAIFYYAGHGIAISGVNYLLPVDADIKSAADVKLGGAINLDLTLDQTMQDAKVKLVFLDACRENPFAARFSAKARTRGGSVPAGLAEMKSGEGTLIAMATAPGQIALDGADGSTSPFTRALIDQITKPGVEIQQAMTKVRAEVNEETYKGQLPWGHTNLVGAVYLNPAPAAAAGGAGGSDTDAAPPSPAAATAAAADVELEFWRAVRNSDNPAELDAYLKAYPNGQFKSLALSRIAALEASRSSAAASHDTAAPVDKQLLDFPEFPSWPPPVPSASYVLPDRLLERYHTLKEATDAILAALEDNGYVQRSFFRTPPGGIALVTRLERIESDGSPAQPGRWAIGKGLTPSAGNLIDFLSGLFFVKKGHYRLIVFVIQDTPFVLSSKKKMTEPDAHALIAQGANVLPAETGKRPFAGNYCTALIYEFSSDGKSVDLMAESQLTGKQHLDKAGVLSLLAKPH